MTLNLETIVAGAAAKTAKVNADDAAAFAQRTGIPTWLAASRARPGGRRFAWSDADDRLLRRQVGARPVEELAAELGRSVTQVDERAIALGVPCRRLAANRDRYTMLLAKHLLGVDGRVLAPWIVIDRAILSQA
jgi:hypothetical protein